MQDDVHIVSIRVVLFVLVGFVGPPQHTSNSSFVNFPYNQPQENNSGSIFTILRTTFLENIF